MEMTAVGKKLLNWLKTGQIYLDLEKQCIYGDKEVPIKMGENYGTSERSVVVEYAGVDVTNDLNIADHFSLVGELRNLICTVKTAKRDEFEKWVYSK